MTIFDALFLSIIVKEQCVVLFPYTALNDDELSLAEGQIVSVITKDVEDKVWLEFKKCYEALKYPYSIQLKT